MKKDAKQFLNSISYSIYQRVFSTKNGLIVVIIYWLIHLHLFAQPKPDFRPKGVFVQDSSAIGLPVLYVLTFRHPPEQQITFPDSTFDFKPFEFIKKNYFDTKTQDGMSLDSVVYYLTTFEINSIQKLALPVLLATETDSTLSLYAEADSLYLKESVTSPLVNEESLKANTQYQSVEERFNYPFLIAGLVFVCLIILIVWGLLGKRILKVYRLFQFRTRHALFINDFTRLTNRITTRQSIEDIERAISLWKKHLEQIEEKPFSTYTSKEITQVVPNEELTDSLKSIDKAIYGKEISPEIGKSLTILKNFSTFRFEKKQEKMRNE